MAEYETVNGSIGLTIVGNTNALVDLRKYAGACLAGNNPCNL